MRVEYEFEVTATCPVDDESDYYKVTVRAGRVIQVEDILKEVAILKATPIFQEAFTESLARVLGAEVESVGWHSGVKTKVTCGEGVVTSD